MGSLASLSRTATLPGGWLGLAFLASACVSEREPVVIDEGDVWSSGLRTQIALDEGGTTSAPGDQHALDFELSFAQGSARQDLAAGETIELDEVTFPGPGTIDYDFEVLEVEAFFRPGHVFSNGNTLHGLFGLGGHEVEVEGALGGAHGSAEVVSLGPRIGAELGHYFSGSTRIFARAWIGTEFASEAESVRTSMLELGLAQAVGRHLALGAGWRTWRYEAESESDSLDPESDLELELAGPRVWLEIRL